MKAFLELKRCFLRSKRVVLKGRLAWSKPRIPTGKELGPLLSYEAFGCFFGLLFGFSFFHRFGRRFLDLLFPIHSFTHCFRSF